MNKPAPHPQYLPAIDRTLEHRAGLLPVSSSVSRSAPARQWLGADFTCTVEVRTAGPAPVRHFPDTAL